ncbi:MAG: 7-carboxy-7-deazaguanine synthase QueE [Phycisphaerae bacterium]|nr:7-carboxy-7-deazaguanine synthase QueE [Phycisphaerae bacterium]
MRVFEIFRSIQGETTRAGAPMDFVRLAGCDLDCVYCDTPAARNPKAGREMTVAEVLSALPCSREHLSLQGLPRPPLPDLSAEALSKAEVMITGGEPLLQSEGTNALIAALADRGCEVLVETSGAHPIDPMDRRARFIVDIKTPGSGMAERMRWENLERLTGRDEVKFVLTGRADYDWARQVVRRHRLAERCPVLFGAADPGAPGLAVRALAEWILADALPVRLNVQIHKVLGLP